MVQVKVGPNKTVFTFHKDLLCNTAAYFRAALEGSFKEALEQSIEMPEDDPEVFKYFQLWIYTGSILQTYETAKDVGKLTLLKLWTFAEALNVTEIQNAAMNLLIDRIEEFGTIPSNLTPYIYEHTSRSSALRKMIVDVSAHRGTLPSWFEDFDPLDFHHDFLCELVVRLYNMKTSKQTKADFTRSDYQIQALVEPAKSSTKD